jgi:hypothetical protein
MACRLVVQHSLAAAILVHLPFSASAQSDRLAAIRNLTPHEHRSEAFVLTSAQAVHITAVGAEPAPERRRRDNDGWWGSDEEHDVWPAAGWILNARTREVVWDLRTARTARADDGLHRFDSTLHLPAGVYEAHYASYPAAWLSRMAMAACAPSSAAWHEAAAASATADPTWTTARSASSSW